MDLKRKKESFNKNSGWRRGLAVLHDRDQSTT